MAGENKRALLIGINEYPNFETRFQLLGCVNDVALMAEVLQSNFGFSEADITILKNAQATRKGILEAFDKLLAETQENDVVVIHYSGHGSQITDLEGDEPDGLDETLVPYDAVRYRGKNVDITDDEIYLFLLKLTAKTKYITLIFDCCHSGTITRDPFGEGSRSIFADDRPVDDLGRSKVQIPAIDENSRDIGPSDWLPFGKNYVLIAGCMDKESSYEFSARINGETVRHGALTYFLCSELLKAESGSTYRDIVEKARPQIMAEKPNQTPQLEGTRDREIFGIRNITPMKYVDVIQRQNAEVILKAGAAHGMRIGSKWGIYGSGTKGISDESTAFGIVEITQVKATTAKGQIIAGQRANEIHKGCRAFEQERDFGDLKTIVEIAVPVGFEKAAENLRQSIDNSKMLRIAGAGETGNVKAYIIAERNSPGPNDPVPQVKFISQPTWVLVDDSGMLLMPMHPVAEPGVTGAIKQNLEQLFRFKQLLKLENPDVNNPLMRKIELHLLRRGNNGEWENAQAGNEQGIPVYQEGDLIGLSVTNHFNQEVYISVLDFGINKKIFQVYPISGANEPLLPGKTLKIGVRQGDELQLHIPEDFPYVLDPGQSKPVGAVETLKVMITSHPADFSNMEQEGVRSLPKTATRSGNGTAAKDILTAFSNVFNLFAHGSETTRNLTPLRVPRSEAWQTTHLQFYLRRKITSVRL